MEEFFDADVSLFKGLNQSELKKIKPYVKIFFCPDQQVLLKQGEQNTKVYYILEGLASISKTDSKESASLINILGSGSSFGEISVLTKKPTTANVIAYEKLKILVLDFAEIAKIEDGISLYSKLMINLTEALSSKLELTRPKNVIPDEPCTILNLFGWCWKDIIYEIPFLAEHGYDAIKLYPVSECVVRKGQPWWTIYQPVSYFLNEKFGSEDDLKSLIHLAHSFGIKVYVDIVGNHMATADQNESEWIGTNGHKFSPYSYPCLNKDGDAFVREDFVLHDEKEMQVSEQDYTKLERIWHLENYCLLGLPKLNYQREHVRAVLRKYLKFLLSLGVDGFRIDAAKHLDIISARQVYEDLLTNTGSIPFIYQEYFLGSPEGVDVKVYMEKYFSLGFVTCFYYGVILADAILKRKNCNLQNLLEFSFGSSWLGFPDNRAVVVLDNHDVERYVHDGLNFKNSPNNGYVLAYIFMLAWPFGIPKIMSSFKFQGHDDAFPQEHIWREGRNTCFDKDSKWVAQHRWDAIANMVLFRKKTKNATGITHKWLNGDQIAFAKTVHIPKKMQYNVAFVVINNTGDILVKRFETGLPEGKYVDLIASSLKEGVWHGPRVDVGSFGVAEIKVQAYSAVVICLDFSE